MNSVPYRLGRNATVDDSADFGHEETVSHHPYVIGDDRGLFR